MSPAAFTSTRPLAHQGAALLAGADLDRENRALLPMNQASEQLPPLSVTDSSEAMLPGRKSTFRLMICAVHAEDHTPLDVRPLLSPAFVVRSTCMSP